jgi:hypothetical protein
MCAELRSDFRTLLGALPGEAVMAHRLRAAADRVADWSWRRAPSGIEYEELLWAERDRMALSEEVAGEAPAGVAADVIGRDASGAVVYARLWNQIGEHPAELCRERREDVSTSWVAGPRRVEIASGLWRDGALTEVRRVWPTVRPDYGFAHERYTRRNGQLVSIARTQGTIDGASMNILSEREFTIDYDEAGQVARIVEPAHGYVLYRRSAVPSNDVPQLLTQFGRQLGDTIVDLATLTSRPPERAYALMLQYDDATDPDRALLPRPMWGLEPDRAELADDPERAFLAWDPGQYALFDQHAVKDRLDGLADTAATLGWALRDQISKTRRDLFVDIAARLNRRDWTELPVTDDFVVLAGELSLVDAHENIQRAVSPAHWARLTRDGWVELPSATR